jgi:hypothetical protein
VVVDSSNSLTNQGTVGNASLPYTVSGFTGVLITTPNAGLTGFVLNSNAISIGDGFTAQSNSTTGITYGLWSATTFNDNYGIRLMGSGPFNGYVASDASGTISVQGNQSYGVSIETTLNGAASTLTTATVTDSSGANAGTARPIALEVLNTLSVTGNNSTGVNIAANVTGDVVLKGTISAYGQGAEGVQTSTGNVVGGATIAGGFRIGGTITSTGYHYTTRPADTTINTFLQPPYTTGPVGSSVNSELFQGGSAVVIGSSVTQGVLIDGIPTAISSATSVTTALDNGDTDADGIADGNQTTGAVASYGGAPAMVIGSATQAVTLGPVGTTDGAATDAQTNLSGTVSYDHALIIKGSVTADAVFDNFNATALQIGGAVTSLNSGAATTGQSQNVTLVGGLSVNGGTVAAVAYESTATAIQIGVLPGGTAAGTVSLTPDPANASTSLGGIVNIGGTISATSLNSNLTTAHNENQQQAIAIYIGPNAVVPNIQNLVDPLLDGGLITAEINGAAGNAIAIQDKSGTLSTLTNTGKIIALTDSSPGTTPIDEQPATSYSNGYCNTTAVGATGTTGCAIALDARNGTTTSSANGLTINQFSSAATTGAASGTNLPTTLNVTNPAVEIIGDIYLSNTNQTNAAGPQPTNTFVTNLNIQAGLVQGVLNLGNGTVNLNVGYSGATPTTALVYGPLIYTGSNLNIDVASGYLIDGTYSALTNPSVPQLNVHNLTVESSGELYLTVDPRNPMVNTGAVITPNGVIVPGSGAVVTGTATFASGSVLGVNFANLVTNANGVTINLVNADAGTLHVLGNLGSGVIHPYLFNVEIGNSVSGNNSGPTSTTAGTNGLYYIASSTSAGDIVSCSANDLCVLAKRQTAAALGMNQQQAQLYNAAYNALADTSDSDLRNLFLNQDSKAGFFRNYNQLLPLSAGASLLSLQDGMEAVTHALADTRPLAEDGESTGWVQEINYYLDKSGSGTGVGFRSHGEGFAGGVERGTPFGAFGVSADLATGDMTNAGTLGTTDLSSTLFEAGLYWRFQQNGWRIWARGAGGLVQFKSNREFIDNPAVAQPIATTGYVAPLSETATANYSGYTMSGGAGVSYEQHFLRRYFLRPEASVEYLYLHEDGYTEQNGGTSGSGTLLGLKSRDGDILSTKVMLNLGARFGDQGQNGITAELHAGYRDNISADAGTTNLWFLADTSKTIASLSPQSLTGGGPVFGFRLMGGGPMGYISLEGDVEDMEGYMNYTLLIRAAFRF